MNRRSFLLAGGACLVSPLRRGSAQTSLGRLAWVDTGGIRVQELPAGQPISVAAGAGLHSPRFSPSGAWIAYRERDHRVSVVPSDGRGTASFEGQESIWLPHQDRLAVRQGSNVEVYGPANDWKAPEASWKDAGIAAFDALGRQYAAPRANQDRMVLTVAAGDRTVRISVPGREGEIRPYRWTRDGKQLIYWRADGWSASAWADGIDLYTVPAAGGPERKLGVTSLVHADELDLSPAGNHLIVASGRGRETWAEQQLVLVDLDTGVKRQLTPPEIAAQCPAWSPDGRTVAYCAGPDAELAEAKATAGTTIRTLNPNGSVTTTVRTPDMRIGIGGGEVAHRFLHLRKIRALDPSGASAPRQLTADARYRDEEPLWSADGTHILFARMDYAGHGSLWLMDSSGSGARQVCALQLYGGGETEPGWFGYYGYINWRAAFDWRR